MNTKLMETKSFHGTLSKDENKIEVNFSIEVEKSGELKISFDAIPSNAETGFIYDNFHKGGTYFEKFYLHGATSDGAVFECENIIFTGLKIFLATIFL